MVSLMEELNYETVETGKIEGTDWAVRRGTLREGLSAGVEVVEVSHGEFSFRVFPTRGMGIWDAHLGDWRIGWDSPVRNPVHPAFVNAKARNGLGWLDGFNELMCRCGLSFFGPPGKDAGNPSGIESDVTLHGNVANIPAHSVQLINEGCEIGVAGVVDETTLFGPQLRLESRVTTRVGGHSIRVQDRITNLGSKPTELSLLYHTNFGTPLLGEGAKLHVAATKVVPNSARSAEGVASYDTYLGPTPGYTEQVYFYETIPGADGKSCVLLEGSKGDQGVSLEFLNSQLPCLTQWKCTQPLQDGYVTGVEPGTNFPNFKSFEREQGRIIQLAAGETYNIDLVLHIHNSIEEVNATRSKILELQGANAPEVSDSPVLPFCSTD